MVATACLAHEGRWILFGKREEGVGLGKKNQKIDQTNQIESTWTDSSRLDMSNWFGLIFL